MTLGEKLRKLLKEKRLSQNDLAEGIGTNQTQVSSWINTDRTPSGAYLFKTARYLGVTVDYLIDPDQVEPMQGSAVTDEELTILQVYRALGITRDQAIRGMAMMVSQNVQPPPRTGDET